MTTFVDTSAFFALLDEDDDNHTPAASWLAGPAADPNELLVTTSYVVVETVALGARRLGPAAVRTYLDAIVPGLSVMYVDATLHAAGERAFLAQRGLRPSLVDCVSFEHMRERGMEQAFAFDRDFRRQGFRVVP